MEKVLGALHARREDEIGIGEGRGGFTITEVCPEFLVPGIEDTDLLEFILLLLPLVPPARSSTGFVS